MVLLPGEEMESGFGVVLLLVDCWQLTRDVAAHSSTSNDRFFMALQLTKVETAARRQSQRASRK